MSNAFSTSPLFVLVLDLQLRDDRRIRERRGVAERLAFGDVAEEAAHDLAGARLRKISGEQDLIRPRDPADLPDDVLLQLRDERVGWRVPLLQRDEGGNRLSLDLVRLADDSGFGDAGIIDERALDLRRAEPVPRDVQHIVHAAQQPVEAVLIQARAVAGEVRAVGPLAPVLPDEAIGIAVDATEHGGPRLRQREQAAAVFDAVAPEIPD